VKPGDNAHAGASLELFNAAFEQDATGMALRAVDPQHSLWLRVNQKLCDMLGYTREEMLKLTSLEVSVPEDRPTVIEFNERLRTGELDSYSREKQYVRKDGTTIWTNICLTAVHDVAGKPIQIIAIIQDISERKAAEEALKKSEEILRSAVESIPDGFALFDSDDRLALVNENFFKGRPELKEMLKLGMTFEEMITYREEFRLREKELGVGLLEIKERLRRHKNPQGPYQSPRPDGRTLQIHEVKTPDGGIAIIRTDVSNLKRAEDSLAENEELYRTLVDSSPNAIYFHKKEEIIYANPAMAALLGVKSADELVGRSALQHVPKDLQETIKNRWRSMLETGQTAGLLDQKFIKADGAAVDVEAQGTRITYKGEPAIMIIAHDITERKIAEDAFRRSEERFRHAFENAPVCIALISPEGNRLKVNQALADFLGYSIEDLTNTEIAETNSDADAVEKSMRLRKKVLDGEVSTYTNARSYRHKQGHTVYGEVSGSLLRDANGGPEYFIEHTVDTTERKLAEQALQSANDDLEMRIKELQSSNQARDRLSQAIEVLPVGVALFDSDDRLLFFNAYYGEQMAVMADILRPGVTYEEMIRTMVARQPVKNARGHEEEFIRERVELHRHPIGPVDIMRDDRWLQADETRLVDGSIFTIISDITELKKTQADLQHANDELEERITERTAHLESEINERKRTELELRTSEERFRTLLDTANYGILVHRNRVPLYANNALAILYGYSSPDEILALDSTKGLTHPDYEENTHEARLGDEQVIADKETQGVKRNGDIFWEDRRSFVINWDGKKAICSIRSDIDERKRTQNALLEAKLEAETLSQVKTDFLANMSHELRTPLNAVIGFSEAILGETFGSIANQKQEEYIQDINNSGHHLLKLINDILDVTAIEEGKLELREDRVEMGPLVEEIFKMVGPRARAGKVAISHEIADSVRALQGDERRFKQILLNLLTNGIKFTPEAGKVALKCHLDGEGQMVFVVTDNGIGMNKAGIRIALEPFGQVDEALDRKYEGTGLGLPLTKQLVESHEGYLEVDSELGVGTTVTVVFPKERVIS
jgi:PAS domain S-box-containing protein